MTDHEFKTGRGRPTSNPLCGICGVRKMEHPGNPYKGEFVNLSTAAVRLKMSVSAVRRRIEKGELDVVYHGSRAPMVTLKSLDKFLESLK